MEFPNLERIEGALSKKVLRIDFGVLLLFVAIVSYTVIFSVISVVKHWGFGTFAWDLGIFTQSLWTTLQGKGFLYHTPELFINPSGSFFGVHFSPILFLVLPIYWIAPAPETLLIFQSFVLALGALPIYKLAKENAGGRSVGLIFVAAYLMFPALQYVNWYDFHVQAFLPLFLGFTIYYATKENWTGYFAFAFLSLLCEEHAASIVFFFGAFLIWKYRKHLISTLRRKQVITSTLLVPLASMIIGVFWYWFTEWQRNTFFPTNAEVLSEFLGAGNFSILGAHNPLEIPLLILVRPVEAVQALAYDAPVKLFYLFLLFAPLAFFSFKSLSLLIPTIPWFGFSLFSQSLAHHMLGHQYETYCIPFIFAAAILGLRQTYLKKGASLRRIRKSASKIIIAASLFLIASPLLPPVRTLFPAYTAVNLGQHERLLHQIIAMVPENASIMTQDNIFPHVSHRVNAYVIPKRFLPSQISQIAIDFSNRTIDSVDYVLMDSETDPISTVLMLEILSSKPQFRLIASESNGTILLYSQKP